MSQLIAEFDWSTTPLGPRAQWSPSMRACVASMLASPVPLTLMWGRSGILLYNDGYARMADDRHPDILGMSAFDAWPGAAALNRHVVESGFAGQALRYRNHRLLLHRREQVEEAWFDLDYSPVYDENETIVAVQAIVLETTDQIAGERRLSVLRSVSERLVAATVSAALGSMVNTLSSEAEIDVPFATALVLDAHGSLVPVASYGAVWLGGSVPVSADLAADGMPAQAEAKGLVRAAFGDGVTRVGSVDALFGALPATASGRAFMLPLTAIGTTVGVLVAGKNASFARDTRYESFFELMARQFSASLGVVKALQEERERARTLTEQVEKALGERAVAEAQLQQSQRMEALGKLTGGVAHDFNNLLQVISGNLQLLTADVAGNERAEKRVQNGLAAVNRGAQLASQLLAFGRRQPLAPKVVNVGRFVRNIDDMLRRTLGDGVEVETIVAGGLWNTSIDPGQFENALLNLAINARDAMEGHGKLTVEVGNASLDSEYVRFHSDVLPGQYVMLAVSDDGCGMTPDIISHVFEPFFTTKPEGRGTGLGLSMVYGFVKQSGGHVKVYSEPGQGSTVRLYLPRAYAPEQPVAPVDTTAPVRGSETILVAEDDEAVRETVVAMLLDLGYQVLKASDAASALTIIDSGVNIDLLFSDVVMPGPLRSPELARRARERLPDIAVLFTSGYTENAIVHGGRLDAGVELLSKPYSREALSRKIRHVLNNRAQAKQAVSDVQGAWPVIPAVARRADVLTILFVEDDELIRENMAELVRIDGHAVIEAGNAAQALALLEQQAVDVLLTDVELPDLSGLDLARRARARLPGLGLVFATGHADVGHRDDAAIADASLLRKPYSRAALNEALARAAGRD
ncbi:response regulator [Chitinasiproducens palmae]|nr:response regulator [Chitinasiproducens palmae]